VIGADGLHSAVRRLAFGPEAEFREDLGLAVAGFSVPNTFGVDHGGLIYNEPGRLAMVASGRDPARATVCLMFAGPVPDYDWHDTLGQKRIVAERFAGAAWQVPALLAALHETLELYFDTISQIRLGRWSAGRVAPLGDAAWCPGGNGTGHTMFGAYTLAGELALAGGDHAAAFGRYEQIMRPPVAKSRKQAAGAARFLTPATERKIRSRSRNRAYRVLSSPVLSGPFGWLARRTASTGTLRDYPLAGPASPGRAGQLAPGH